MPEFPVIDTHLHVWDPEAIDYPWLQQLPNLNRPYLPSDYRKACGPTEVEAMVFLQCEAAPAQAVREARWVSELAVQEPRIRGIVPWAPIEQGERCQETLEELISIPNVKGIRRIIQHEQDPQFCLRPDFLRGLRLLPSLNLSFDICIFHHQMAQAVEMVRQCPEVFFILDHIGKPGIKEGKLEPWKTEVRKLSELDNVACKMSGLVVEADLEHWTREDLKPYIDHVIDCFGFDRILFGGDWPVVLMAAEWREWVETLDWALSGCSGEERKKLYHDNALLLYKLSG